MSVNNNLQTGNTEILNQNLLERASFDCDLCRRVFEAVKDALIAIARLTAIVAGTALFFGGFIANIPLLLRVIVPQIAVKGVMVFTENWSEGSILREGIRKCALIAHAYFLFTTALPFFPPALVNHALTKIGEKLILMGTRNSPHSNNRHTGQNVRLFFLGLWIFRNYYSYSVDREESNQNSRIYDADLTQWDVSTIQNTVLDLTQNSSNDTKIDKKFLFLINKVHQLQKRSLETNQQDFLEQLNGLEEILSSYLESKKVEERNVSILENLQGGKASRRIIWGMGINKNAMLYNTPEITIPNCELEDSELARILDEKSNELGVTVENQLRSNQYVRLRNLAHGRPNDLKMLKSILNTLMEKPAEESDSNFRLLIQELNWGEGGCNHRLHDAIFTAYREICSDNDSHVEFSFEEKIHLEAQKLRDQLFEEAIARTILEIRIGDEASKRYGIRATLQHKLGLSYQLGYISDDQDVLRYVENIFNELYTKERLLDHFMRERKDSWGRRIYAVTFQEVIEYLVAMKESPFQTQEEAWRAVYDPEDLDNLDDNIGVTRATWAGILTSLEYPLLTKNSTWDQVVAFSKKGADFLI